MSESDYQRGLRGGSCNVSIGDHERWDDWKTGRDEYERQQNERDEVRIVQTLTKPEQIARIDARIKARHAGELASELAELERRANDREFAHNRDIKDLVLTSTFLLVVFFVGGAIGGAILTQFSRSP